MIIALTGKKRSGKDSFAAALVADHGFVRCAFADPIRSTLEQIDPWITPDDPGEHATSSPVRLHSMLAQHSWDDVKANAEVRRLLQQTGQAVRAHRPSIWTDLLMTALDTLPQDQHVVVTDVRMRDEVDALRARGAHLVRIIRPSLIADSSAAGRHLTETQLDDVPMDSTIVNESDLTHLATAAARLVSTYDESRKDQSA